MHRYAVYAVVSFLLLVSFLFSFAFQYGNVFFTQYKIQINVHVHLIQFFKCQKTFHIFQNKSKESEILVSNFVKSPVPVSSGCLDASSLKDP